MFKIRIVGKDSEKEIRLNEEGLKGFVSPFVVQQAKVMGFAKTTVISMEKKVLIGIFSIYLKVTIKTVSLKFFYKDN